MPSRIVTYAFRRRRQSRKKPKAAALAVPAIVKVDRTRRRADDAAPTVSPETAAEAFLARMMRPP